MAAGRAIVWLLSAGVLLAAEQTAPPSSSVPLPEDSVAAARRDLEAIKTARGTPRRNAERSPAIFGAGPSSRRADGFVGGKAPNGQEKAAKKAENWLVDAMQKKSSRGPDGRESDEEILTLAREAKLTPDDTEATASRRTNRQSPRPVPHDRAESAANPLSQFMSAWMTPQDYKLLQPTWGREAGGGPREEFPSAVPANPTGSAVVAGALGRAPAEPGGRQARENPFLAALSAAPTSQAPSAPATSAPAPAPAKPTASAMPPPPESTPKNAPSFVKPLEDAKYFKPLKRF